MKRFKNLTYIVIVLISVIIIYKFSQFINNGQSTPEKVIVYKKEDVEALLKEHFQNRPNPQPVAIKDEKNKVIAAKEIKYSFLTRYPNMLGCNTQSSTLPKWSPDQTSFFSHNDYKTPTNESNFNQRIVRGVLVYFPIEKSNEFMSEFKWLYRSWIEMTKSEPTKWRTDLIVFIENKENIFQSKEFFLNELDCSFKNIRKSKEDKPMCTLVDYKPIAARQLKQLTDQIFYNENESEKKKKFEYLLSKVDIFSSKEDNLLPFYTLLKVNLNQYGYTDSILMGFDGYEYFKSAQFDFLIRSDMDVFLTPLFSKWLPKHCNDFIVGGGAYSENFNRKRLKRIAIELGIEHAGADNLG